MSDDFKFYEENSEEDYVREIKGVTDKVSEYVYSNMEFPCICLKPDIVLPKYKWVAISKLVKLGSPDKSIFVYIHRNGELYKLGALSGVQVKAFIEVAGLENIFGYHNKDIILKDDRVYVLASSF